MPVPSVLRRLPGFALLLVAGPLLAQEAPKRTTFTGDVGYVNVSGNRSLTTFSLADKLTHTTGRWILTQEFSSIFAKAEGETNAEFYRASLRGDYALSPRLTAFGVAGWDRNRFAGIRNRYSQDLGVKFLAAGSKLDTLSVEAGGGLIQQTNLDGSALDFAAARTAARYRHSFTERAYVAQTAEYIVNGEDTQDYRINTETSLVAPINGFLSVKLGYLVRFQNRPPVREAGPPVVLFRTTDYVFTSGLQVTF